MRPLRYLCYRALHSVLVLVAGSVLLFAVLQAVPGDFLDDLRLNPQISPETVAVLRRQYGMDEAVPTQYFRWAASVVRGEFGFSLLYNRPVGPLLRERAINTLLLTVTATLLAWSAAVPIGAMTARRRGTLVDRATGVAVAFLVAVPDLLLALVLLLLATDLGGLPAGGMVSPGMVSGAGWERVRDVVTHLALPALALSLLLAPVVVRHVRASLIEALDAPFIQAARAAGASDRRLVYRHALRAAATPIVSLLGLSIGSLLSASIAVEAIMSWPGMGPLLLEAIHARDVHLVVGVALASTCFLLAGNLVADGLVFLVDPRTRS
jgi:peptide/nickel transport system permease protein